MKQIKMTAILMVMVLGGLTSCTKDNSGTSAVALTATSNGKGGGAPVGNTRAILESGTWAVTAFSDGQNSISFAGDAFNFSDDGTARVTVGQAMYTGSWATTAETQDLIHLDYGEAPTPLPALNGDWQVVNIDNSIVQVQRYNGKGSFTFQKM